MADKFVESIIQHLVRDIADLLSEAAIIARTADGLGKEGLMVRACQSLLELEPLLYEATILMNAASIAKRRDSRPVD